jgi:carbonic anhydrase
MTAQDAWDRLRAGNERFVSNRMEHPDQSPPRRVQVAKGQHPFAAVLACSDSRVPPEIIFDTGLGDIFVIRVAGNTADDAAVASMEYAVEHLHVPLIVVLGHQRCGAVQAAVEADQSHGRPEGHLPAILDPILPAVRAVKGQGGDVVENAVRENVLRVVHQAQNSRPILVEAVRAHHLGVLGADYELDTGRVSLVQGPQAVPVGH